MTLATRRMSADVTWNLAGTPGLHTLFAKQWPSKCHFNTETARERSTSKLSNADPFWRTSLQDGVYGLGVNLLRSGLVNQNRYIGSQASTGIHWQANRHLTISAAYTHFFVEPFLSQGPSPGRDVDNAAIWATYKF